MSTDKAPTEKPQAHTHAERERERPISWYQIQKKIKTAFIFYLSIQVFITSSYHRFIVKVVSQSKAWCDKNIMKSWISENWVNHFLNSATPESTRKILFADIHRTQKSNSVKQLLYKNKAVLINISGGSTSRVQPLKKFINKPFKN